MQGRGAGLGHGGYQVGGRHGAGRQQLRGQVSGGAGERGGVPGRMDGPCGDGAGGGPAAVLAGGGGKKTTPKRTSQVTAKPRTRLVLFSTRPCLTLSGRPSSQSSQQCPPARWFPARPPLPSRYPAPPCPAPGRLAPVHLLSPDPIWVDQDGRAEGWAALHLAAQQHRPGLRQLARSRLHPARYLPRPSRPVCRGRGEPLHWTMAGGAGNTCTAGLRKSTVAQFSQDSAVPRRISIRAIVILPLHSQPAL